ncbi:unnamed protein product, partial [Litomosoides sigmodontis]
SGKMHILFVPHVMEMFSAMIIMFALLLWPVHTCREVTDSEFEDAYAGDKKCALELHENLKLVRNDTVVQVLHHFDKSLNNGITWINTRNEYYYEKPGINSICVALGIRERFGSANSKLGCAHLLIPVFGAMIAVFFLWAHIIEFLRDDDDSAVGIQVFCGIICWLIISVSLTIIDFNWNGTVKLLRNFGASFPFEWKICKYIGWLWICIKIIELLLANCYKNIRIKFDKPYALAIVKLPSNFAVIDEYAPPYPNEFDMMTSAGTD